MITNEVKPASGNPGTIAPYSVAWHSPYLRRVVVAYANPKTINNCLSSNKCDLAQ